MRKILISILVCLLLIGSAFFMVNGISKVNIKGIKGLSEKNGQIEQKISDLSNVISVTYANTESNLKRTANTLQDSKTEYENQAALSNSLSPSYASQLETYDIDYLWTKLGNYARDEKVVIKIDLVASGTSTNLYNLNFTTTGDYVNITNFIYEIENDSKLGFKIDEFKMNSSGDTLTATFSCKEVPIKVGSIDQATSNNQGGTTQSGVQQILLEHQHKEIRRQLQQEQILLQTQHQIRQQQQVILLLPQEQAQEQMQIVEQQVQQQIPLHQVRVQII